MASGVSASANAVQDQIVTPSQTNISAAPGTDVTFDVNYSTNPSDPTLAGLGLRMYYNSSQLTFNGFSNVLANGEILQETPQDDTSNSDGDPSTDKYVTLAWADMNEDWPGVQSARLFSADFTLNPAATSSTRVNFNASSTAAGWTLAATPVTITPNAAPTIGGVVVSTAKKVITWNAADSDGVTASTLTIDGKNAAQIYGPYKATSGVNYSAAIGTLTAGSHEYVITATDKAGHSSSFSDSFDVVAVASSGPTISGVAVSLTKGKITWNAADPTGMASVGLAIDGKTVSNIGGPYTAAVGANYSAALGTLSAGSHLYTITATDKAGHSSTYNDSFIVIATPVASPTITGVAVSFAKAKITWNAADPVGIASVGLAIDNKAVSGVSGPYAAASGANYAWSLGSLRAGDHTYRITATDKAGRTSTVTGTFSVPSSLASSASGTLVSDAVLGALAGQAAASAKLQWLYYDSDMALA